MGDESAVVADRGVLRVPDDVWACAVRQAEVIGRLTQGAVVGHEAADAAAAELGISRRQVYLLLARWRAGEGVVSDLLPRRSSGGRGREHLPAEVEVVMRDVVRTRYLTRQRRSVAAVHREIRRVCLSRGLPVPSRGALVRRIAKLDPVVAVTARQGADAARPLRSAGGSAPAVEQLLEQVQIDHTVVDVMVVDERHRLPIGRPYVTGAIDVCSRCIVGLVVTLEAPSALSVGLCLAHMVTDKQTWLERLERPVAKSEVVCTVAHHRSYGPSPKSLMAMAEVMLAPSPVSMTTTREGPPPDQTRRCTIPSPTTRTSRRPPDPSGTAWAGNEYMVIARQP